MITADDMIAILRDVAGRSSMEDISKLARVAAGIQEIKEVATAIITHVESAAIS